MARGGPAHSPRAGRAFRVPPSGSRAGRRGMEPCRNCAGAAGLRIWRTQAAELLLTGCSLSGDWRKHERPAGIAPGPPKRSRCLRAAAYLLIRRIERSRALWEALALGCRRCARRLEERYVRSRKPKESQYQLPFCGGSVSLFQRVTTSLTLMLRPA